MYSQLYITVVLFYCWANVCDAGPIFKPHFPCLLRDNILNIRPRHGVGLTLTVRGSTLVVKI